MAAGGREAVQIKRIPDDNVVGMRLFLFFVFVLTFFAIYVLCLCAVGWTIFGMLILSFCLMMTIATYVSLA